MSKKKLFSQIYGDNIHLAPGVKHLPAKDVGKVLDAEELYKQIHVDVEKYRMQVAKECEELKEQAQKEGYAAGFAEWAEHVAALETQIHDVRKEIEKLLIPIALRAAKKIVGREIELSEHTVVDIVGSSLKSVATHKKIAIYANRRDLNVLEKYREELKNLFEHIETLSLRERDDLAPNCFIIETEGGIINAQIENQWAILEQAFSARMKKTLQGSASEGTKTIQGSTGEEVMPERENTPSENRP